MCLWVGSPPGRCARVCEAPPRSLASAQKPFWEELPDSEPEIRWVTDHGHEPVFLHEGLLGLAG